jgi:hypothetical protein
LIYFLIRNLRKLILKNKFSIEEIAYIKVNNFLESNNKPNNIEFMLQSYDNKSDFCIRIIDLKNEIRLKISKSHLLTDNEPAIFLKHMIIFVSIFVFAFIFLIFIICSTIVSYRNIYYIYSL